MIFDKKGITLIEILIVVGIIGIIAGIGSIVFDTGLLSWNFAQDSLLSQEAAKEVVSLILEGNDFFPGIREALVIKEASRSSLTVLPLWRDIFVYKGGLKVFYLTKFLAEDARIPICWVRSPGSVEFVLTQIELSHDEKGHFILIPQELKEGSTIKILYKADPSREPSVYMRIFYDSSKKTIMRQYGLKSENLIKSLKGIKIDECRFNYFTNVGEELMLDKGGSVLSAKIQDISGLSLYVKARRREESFELETFAGLRNLRNLKYGLALNQGTNIKIPDSRHIKGLSIDFIEGVNNNDEMKLAIAKNNQDAWVLSVKFGIVGDKPYITSYKIQYPAGVDAYSSGPVKIEPEEGLNLMTLDKNGLYDYDDDLDLADRVMIIGDDVTLKVLRMDVDSATAYIRP